MVGKNEKNSTIFYIFSNDNSKSNRNVWQHSLNTDEKNDRWVMICTESRCLKNGRQGKIPKRVSNLENNTRSVIAFRGSAFSYGACTLQLTETQSQTRNGRWNNVQEPDKAIIGRSVNGLKIDTGRKASKRIFRRDGRSASGTFT